MANGETKIKDLGFDSIREQIKVSDSSSVDIGIMRGEKYKPNQKFKGVKLKTNLNVAEIAIVHEFGSEKVNIPERSFLRSNADEKRAKYKKVLKDLFGEVVTGKMTTEQALNLFGERVVGDVKRKITSIRVPPNAPSTQKQKGFDNPLIRTGTLRSRIKKRVKL